MKLYNVPETSAVGQLVSKIESICNQKGFSLSRWQANQGGHSVSITYAVHAGDRARQFRYQPSESVKSYEYLSQMEGTTERSEAYRKLSRLLAEIEVL